VSPESKLESYPEKRKTAEREALSNLWEGFRDEIKKTLASDFHGPRHLVARVEETGPTITILRGDLTEAVVELNEKQLTLSIRYLRHQEIDKVFRVTFLENADSANFSSDNSGPLNVTRVSQEILQPLTAGSP
jgi:hypothetical protein